MKVAAITRARGISGPNVLTVGTGLLGAGVGREATAKEHGVGTTAVNAARRELSAAIDSTADSLVFGVSSESLGETARTADDRMKLELWVAEQAPWRLRHAAARKLFPI